MYNHVRKKSSHHPKKWIWFHSNGIVNPFLPFYSSYSRPLREVSQRFGNMYNGWMETPAVKKKESQRVILKIRPVSYSTMDILFYRRNLDYPAPPRLIRPWVRPWLHACRLGIQRNIAQAQQIRFKIMNPCESRTPVWTWQNKKLLLETRTRFLQPTRSECYYSVTFTPEFSIHMDSWF